MDDDSKYPLFQETSIYMCIYIIQLDELINQLTTVGGSLCLSGSVIFNERLQVETSSTIDWILWGINDQTRLQQLQLNNQSRLRLSNRGSETLQKRSTTTAMITSSQYSMYRISTNILSLRPKDKPIPMRSISFPYELEPPSQATPQRQMMP